MEVVLWVWGRGRPSPPSSSIRGHGDVGRAVWRGCAHSPTDPHPTPDPPLLPIYCFLLFILNIKKRMLQKRGTKNGVFYSSLGYGTKLLRGNVQLLPPKAKER